MSDSLKIEPNSGQPLPSSLHPTILAERDGDWAAAPTLHDFVTRSGPLTPVAAMTILTAVAGGLEALRIARQPTPGINCNRVRLLPPDASRPRFETDATPADPTQCLAAIAYEMLAGHPAHEHAPGFSPLRALPEAANRVLRRGLDPTLGDRSPVAFVADLGDAIDDPCGVVSAPAACEVTIPPPAPGTPPIDRIRLTRAPRRRVPTWLAASVVLTTVLLLIVVWTNPW